MPIKELLKFDEIKQNKLPLKIDYGDLDPAIRQHNAELKAHAQLVVEEADKKAEEMVKKATENARKIVETAEAKVADLRKKEEAQLASMKKQLEEDIEKKKSILMEEIQKLRDEFEHEKERELQKIEASKEDIKKEVMDNIWETAKAEADKETKATYERLIDQVHAILNEIIKRRNEILADAEEEMTELIMLIVRKVVKGTTEKDDTIVIRNIVEAITKLKGREKFIIRVNIKQLSFVKNHIDNIKKYLESHMSILVLEDTSVDEGGCIIETEFGNIDARISTQIAEIEKRVRDSGFVKHVSF